MQIEFLIYLLLASQVALILIFLSGRNKSKENQLLRDELQRINRDLNLALTEARKESSENLIRQFQLVFENQRSGSKDQNEALRQFGDTFRQSMQDLSNMQREKLSELSRRQEELVKNTEERLEKINPKHHCEVL